MAAVSATCQMSCCNGLSRPGGVRQQINFDRSVFVYQLARRLRDSAARVKEHPALPWLTGFPIALLCPAADRCVPEFSDRSDDVVQDGGIAGRLVDYVHPLRERDK